MVKVRRNSPCPCGSGAKFKKCCGSPIRDSTSMPSPEELRRISQLNIERSNAREHRRRLMQGLGRPIISIEAGEYRIVAVGNQICWGKDWGTFADFLSYFIKSRLGGEWGNAELSKPPADQHPILIWYQLFCEFQKANSQPDRKVQFAHMTGAAKAYMSLAYDLYLCAHNAELSEKLIQRLRSRQQFEGAYYELFVIGCFSKAGFEIEFEDEDDVSSSHCEFVATHKSTGRKFSVEAKAVSSQSSRAGESATPPKIRGKLHAALRKQADHPRIVFVELNRKTDTTQGSEPAWLAQIADDMTQSEKDLTIEGQAPPEAYVFVSNRSYLHDFSGTATEELIAAFGFRIVDFPPFRSAQSILEAYDARERHIEIHWLLKAIITHSQIPTTFDDRLPEEVFSSGDVVSLRIGEQYSVPTGNGSFAVGTLETASVADSSAYGVYRLEDGKRIICTSPLTDAEIEAYKRSPETFFHALRPISRNIDDPLDAFDFFFETYSSTPREKLLEFMKSHPNLDAIQSMSQQELARLYCATMAESMWARRVATRY